MTDQLVLSKVITDTVHEAVIGAKVKWAYLNNHIILGHVFIKMTRKSDGFEKEICIAEVKMHMGDTYFTIRDLETVNAPWSTNKQHTMKKDWMKIFLADPEMLSKTKEAIIYSKSTVNDRYKRERKRKRKAPEWH